MTGRTMATSLSYAGVFSLGGAWGVWRDHDPILSVGIGVFLLGVAFLLDVAPWRHRA